MRRPEVDELVDDKLVMTWTFRFRLAEKPPAEHPEFHPVRPTFATVVLERHNESAEWEIMAASIQGTRIRVDGRLGTSSTEHAFTTHAGRFVDPHMPPWLSTMATACHMRAEETRRAARP